MIQVNDVIPALTVQVVRKGQEVHTISTESLFQKKTLLVSIPGAFTPVCSTMHIPGLIQKMPQLMANGVEQIGCLTVNDPFVVSIWAEQLNAPSELFFLADGNIEFTEATGLTFDGTASCLGKRARRMAMLIHRLKVEKMWVEPDTTFCTISSAVFILNDLLHPQ